MPQLDRHFLDHLRARTNILDIVAESGVKIKKTGLHQGVGLCPFHQEKTPSFSANSQKNVFNCFGCGESGDTISYIQKIRGLDFVGAVKYLAERYSIPLPVDGNNEPIDTSLYKKRAKYKKILLYVHEAYFRRGVRGAHDYLVKRGVNSQSVDDFEIGFCASNDSRIITDLHNRKATDEDLVGCGLYKESDRDETIYLWMAKRVIFPIFDKNDNLVGFGARRIDAEKRAKYINSPNSDIFKKDETLYGLKQARASIRKKKKAVLVEGYTDVIAMHQAGMKTAVSSLGTAISEKHIRTLWDIGADTPIVCMDGDKAGMGSAERIAFRIKPFLRAGCSVKFAFLPTGEDPESMIRNGQTKKLVYYLENAYRLVDVLWRFVVAKHLPTDEREPEKVAAFKKHVISLHEDITDNSVREQYKRLFFQWTGSFIYGKKQENYQYEKPKYVHVSNNETRQVRMIALMVRFPVLIESMKEGTAEIHYASERVRKAFETLFETEETDSEVIMGQLKENDQAWAVEKIEDKEFCLGLPTDLKKAQTIFANMITEEIIKSLPHDSKQSVMDRLQLKEELNRKMVEEGNTFHMD